MAALRYRIVESGPGGFARRMAPRIRRRFEQGRPPPTAPPRLLDVGCGTGQLMHAFAAAGYTVTGVDPSANMLAEARALGLPPSTLLHGGIEAVPEQPTFDLITATFNVLNHLPDHRALDHLLASVAERLAPNGRFIFDINTPAGLRSTAETTQIQRSATFQTEWRRHWDGDRLVLQARGWFDHDGRRYDYDESIRKIVIEPAALVQQCAAHGLSPLQWLGDDLLTPVDRPDDELLAFGVVSLRR